MDIPGSKAKGSRSFCPPLCDTKAKNTWNNICTHPYVVRRVAWLNIARTLLAMRFRGPIPVAEQCKARVCSRLMSGITGSYNVGGMFVCLFWVLLLLAGKGLCNELIARPEESYRLWCVIVWSRNPKKENAMVRAELQRHSGKKVC